MRALVTLAALLALSACVPLIPKTACTGGNISRGTADCSNFSNYGEPTMRTFTIDEGARSTVATVH